MQVTLPGDGLRAGHGLRSVIALGVRRGFNAALSFAFAAMPIELAPHNKHGLTLRLAADRRSPRGGYADT